MEQNTKRQLLKEVAIFFGVTLFLSFGIFWGPIAALKIPTINLVEGKSGPLWAIVLFIIGGFVPSIAGILLTGIYEKKDGIKRLLKSSINYKFNIKYYLLMGAISVYCAGALIMLYETLGGKFDYTQFLIQLPSIIPLILLGPISEEYGWRGFALKRLLKCVNPNLASLIVGLIWSFWHLPLFYMIGTSQYESNLPFLTFLIIVTSSSLIYTYMFKVTKESVFSAIFYHWLNTYVLQVISTTVKRTSLYNWLEFIPSLLIGVFFAYLLHRKERLAKVTSASVQKTLDA